ncbi:hypothetical protein BS47DRAFT_1386416 [Hydnum rufescens UP504]|uniref:Uncharacterized protein n=1 Tax=Hydnum rufescens UP504 TaxID=1448309 RepID=A0A9P6AEB6_9AGAM|nr:hypothetical protein BS47DRAFT_1386416 [Hydnum rufescens UP504]
MSSPQELVVGCPTKSPRRGLAPALVLRKNGIVVRLIGKALDYQIGVRSNGMQPRILEQFKILGMVTDIFDNCIKPPQMKTYGGRTVIKTWEFGVKEPATPAVPYNETLEVEWVMGADGAREMEGLDRKRSLFSRKYWAAYGSAGTRLVLAWAMGSAPHFSVVGNGTQEEIQEVVNILYLASKDASQGVNPGFLHDDIFKQVGVNYQWSEIVLDQHLDSRKKVNVGNKVYMWYGNGDERIQAGDRALDAPNLVLVPAAAEPTTTARLLDLLTGFAHTALDILCALGKYNKDGDCLVDSYLVLPENALDARSGEWLGMNRVFVDTQGHARKAYDVDTSQTRKALLLVVVDLLWCICT